MPRFSLVAVAALLLSAAVGANADRDVFDCAMRNYAVEFAAYLQPWRGAASFQQLADALNGAPEKAAGCTVQSLPQFGVAGGSRFRHAGLPTAGMTYYVSPTGSDAGAGTVTSPFATIEFALATSRSSPGFDTIVLRAGTYFLAAPLVLGPADKGLTIQSFPGEDAWLSGAKPLTGISWAPYNIKNASWVVAQNSNAIWGQVPSPNVFYNGTYPTWAGCEAACRANNTAAGGKGCNVWTWHDSNQGGYELQCYFRLDGVWSLVGQAGHVAGRLAPPTNMYQAPLAALNIPSVPGLRLNGARMIRARFPNANPETDLFMPPFVFRANSWTPQQSKRAPDVQIDFPASVVLRNNTVSAFQVLTAGIGGTCDRFEPPAGYWCSNTVQGGGSVIFYAPQAMQVDTVTLPNSPYKDGTTAVIQTWRPGHWASWMAEVGSAVWDPATNTTNFTISKGLFQGSRGEDSGEDTYIENVMEELDSPAEYFYDTKTQMLYYWHNATGAPPTDGSLAVTQTKGLLSILGTAANPVTDVSIVGVGFRDTAYTYMDPHGIPSGGDWTLERSAVVFLEGTVGVTVRGCVFERVDGNAVMLSAYNRNATIVENEFAWIGATAVALWGNTDGGDSRLPPGYGVDGSAGDQPRHNIIGYNLCRELGVWEKQSSFYTQFKSSENTIVGNIVWNGPRAHVNFNDGFRGGAVLEHNLLVNSCRESSDHGPFNSWDRDPYIFDGPDGKPTTTKMFDVIRNNFILANFQTLGAIDNDDGSSYYHTYKNFFVYVGGLKNDFEGHDNIWEDNVLAYLNTYAMHNGYGGEIGTPGNGILDGHEHVLYRNKIVLESDDQYAYPICSGRGKSRLANNSIFSPLGNVSECGLPLVKWQAANPAENDVGTTQAKYYAGMDTDLIAWAREVLMTN